MPLSVLQQPSRSRPFRRRRPLRARWLLLIAALAILVVYILPTPWALHIGGKFTPLEQWDGVAAVTATNRGHYVLYTHLQGGLMGTRHPCSFESGCDTLNGNAKLCTENGSTYSLKLTGAVHSWWSTDGASTNIDLTGKPLPQGWVVAFKGKWAGPALPLADTDNSFTEVFTAARSGARPRPRTRGSRAARFTTRRARLSRTPAARSPRGPRSFTRVRLLLRWRRPRRAAPRGRGRGAHAVPAPGRRSSRAPPPRRARRRSMSACARCRAQAS